MLSHKTRVRLAGVVALAAAVTTIGVLPAPAGLSTAAVDPTRLTDAARAADAAKAALARASASAATVGQAVASAEAALTTASDALVAARNHTTQLGDRVEEATSERLFAERDGGLLDVAEGATDAATGDSDSALISAAGTAVTAGLAGVVGPVISALNPLADAVEEQVADADQAAADAQDREEEERAAQAEAVQMQRDAATKVWDAEGLLDAAEAALVTAEQQEEDAGARSATAAEAAAAFADSLGIHGRLVRPATGAVSSPYGMRTHPITGAHRLHSGTDFQYGNGRAYAAAGGTVASVVRDSGYGNMVTIAHGDGITTRYAHLAGPGVRAGDKVAAGQVVGQIGSTGLSTGPHLHFEVQVGGQFQDSGTWLAR
ncbi:MAG: M23 family metallopeptidase [Jiangellaceae bacterium]